MLLVRCKLVATDTFFHSTRSKPHKCPEYFPSGQKCDFATADPSSLHRHRKRKHGYKPRSSTANSSGAASGGARDKSIDPFESEESFVLRPEATRAPDDTPPECTNDNSSYAIHRPYFNLNKLPEQRYDSPHYPPLVLKVPDWIGVPPDLPFESTFQTFSCSSNFGNLSTEFASPRFTNDTSLLEYWPDLASEEFNGRCATVYHLGHELSAEASTYISSSSSASSSSPLALDFPLLPHRDTTPILWS